ncbi:hypothetical protein ACTQ6A_13885 [Lachnospiraceae bacterium LCP25S3_G4]
MSENYLVINGKKTELTQKQLAQLGIEVKKENPFDVKYEEEAFYINVKRSVEKGTYWTKTQAEEYMPCKDKRLVEERAKQERLSRLLWKFAIENDCYVSKEEKKDGEVMKFTICFDSGENKYFVTSYATMIFHGSNVFKSKEVAQRAIDEVIRPFERGEIE